MLAPALFQEVMLLTVPAQHQLETKCVYEYFVHKLYVQK